MQENEILDLVKRLVRINSVFPHENVFAEYITVFLQDLGYHIQKVPVAKGRDNVIATLGNTNSYLGFYGHMDTVPPDPLWKQNPFEAKVNNGRLTGLGVADMKGGIALILLLAKYASENKLPIKLVFGVDEENISLGSHKLVQTNCLNDISFLISAESGQVRSNDSDFAVNYGRKGYFKLEAAVSGKKAHAARSDLALNAISESMKLIKLIMGVKFVKHRHLGDLEVIPTYINSTTDSFSIPDKAVLTFNILTVPGVKSNEVVEKFQKIARQKGLNVTLTIPTRESDYLEAYEVNLKNPFLRKLEKKIFSNYKVSPTYAQSVADENQFANKLKIPVISIGPIGGGDHTAKEWVDISSLGKTLKIYKEILLESE